MDTSKAIVKLLCFGVIKRTQGGDDLYGLRRRCGRANEFIERFWVLLEVDMGKKIVLIEITCRHRMFCIIVIEKQFPFLNLFFCLFA